jgi:hypothetical protein
MGKGLIQPEWHRELETEIRNYNRTKLIYEVTKHPYELPDVHHREAARELLERSIRAVRENNWNNLDEALKDGFIPNQSDGSHFHNIANIQDGKTLVPGQPEYLIFNTNADGQNVLAGFMYLVNTRSKSGPQIGGPLTQWHYHVFAKDYCFEQGNILLADVTQKENCPNGTLLDTTTEMLHVWFVDHPDGRFGTRMDLPAESYKSFLYEKRGTGEEK